MTGQDFGRAFSAREGEGHGYQWASNILTGRARLSLDELDEAARILKTTAASLVKSDFETAEYLTPTEHRILEAIRALPPPIRDHVQILAEYLVGVAPEEVDHLMEFRELMPGEREKIQHWTHALKLAREPMPELAILPDHQQTDAKQSATGHRTRDRQKKKP
jgi:hypothetical protein